MGRFAEILAMRKPIFDPLKEHRLLCLDPGETTGWALFVNGELTESGQAKTLEGGWREIHDLFEYICPTFVVYENYRVYGHKLERHANSEVYTLRLVGVIEYLCEVVYGISWHNQMAAQAKGFATDEKLKKWNMYQTGKKHARDAIRHGIYYLLFTHPREVKK